MQTVSDYFGSLVFDDRVMRARLPEKVYKSLKKTIDEGVSLDNQVANAVAEAMRDWAVEHGATHFTHWFQPLTGITAEKARQLHQPVAGRRRDHGIFRQGADSGRAGRVELPVGRSARDI